MFPPPPTSRRRQEVAEKLLELIDALERYQTEGEADLVRDIRRELAFWAYGLSPAFGLSGQERNALVWGPHLRARQVALRLRIG